MYRTNTTSFATTLVAFSLAFGSPVCFGVEPVELPAPRTRPLLEQSLPKGTTRFFPVRAAPTDLLTVHNGLVFIQGGERAKQGQVDWRIVAARPRDEVVAVFGISSANDPDDMAYDTWGKSNLVVSKGCAPGGTWQLRISADVGSVGCYFRVGEGELEGYYLNFETEPDEKLTKLTGSPCYRAIVTPKPGPWSLLKMRSERPPAGRDDGK